MSAPELTAEQPRGAHALLEPRSPLDVPPQRWCGWCGASDAEASMRVAHGDTDPTGPLVRCRNIRECTERKIAKLAEEMARAQAEAKAAAKAAAARSKRAAAGTKGKTAARPPRPSRARRALESTQGQASEAPTIVPGEPADPASGSPGEQDGGGDEAV